jgi:hypothetical protein
MVLGCSWTFPLAPTLSCLTFGGWRSPFAEQPVARSIAEVRPDTAESYQPHSVERGPVIVIRISSRVRSRGHQRFNKTVEKFYKRANNNVYT